MRFFSERTFFLPETKDEQQRITKGRFYRITKSDIEFFVDGKKYWFHDEKTEVCSIKEGSVVVIRYKSVFVYDALGLAFWFEDKINWIPIPRRGMRVLDSEVDPASVTAEMIEGLTKAPSRGRPGKILARDGNDTVFQLFLVMIWQGQSIVVSGRCSGS